MQNDFANRSLMLHLVQVRNDLQNRFTLKMGKLFLSELEGCQYHLARSLQTTVTMI